MISPNGFDNIQWFMGIVEDNQDPTNGGRVRVRCFGIHPSYESGLMPKEDLPWAVPINGSYGGSSQIPRVTDWVFGFFADGRDAQHPFLMGVIPGQNLQSMSGSGEGNQGAYVAPSHEAERYFAAPPLRPAQSGENLHETQVVLQDATRRDGVEVARDGHPDGVREERGWSEPAVAVSGDPAKTTIFSSTYGDSFIEVNGQENNEFISISHSSGSHIQIDRDGDIKIRSMSDLYLGAESNVREYNGARRDVTIEGKYTINVKDGDCTLEVAGDLNHVVHGDYNLNVAGRAAFSIGLGLEVIAARMTFETVAEHFNIISAEKVKIECEDHYSLKTGGNMYNTVEKNIYQKAEEKMLLGATDDLLIRSNDKVRIKGDSYVSITDDVRMNRLGLIDLDHRRVKRRIRTNCPAVRVSRATPTMAPLTGEVPQGPQVDVPVDQRIATEGNQGGQQTQGAFNNTTSGAGNPTSASVTDDFDQANQTIDLNIETQAEYQNLIGEEIAVYLRAAGFSEDEILAFQAVATNESGLDYSRVESGYGGTSNSRIREIFSSTRRLTDSELTTLKSNDQTFFNYIYGDAGAGPVLGNTTEGDGFAYRGRGFIQLTGRYNYEKYGIITGYDIVSNPDLMVETKDVGYAVTAAYLEDRLTRTGDPVYDVARAVKGSTTGLNLTIDKDRAVYAQLKSSTSTA